MNTLNKTLLWFFSDGNKDQGRIPLGLSKRAIVFAAIGAIVISLLVGNLALKLCLDRSMNLLETTEYELSPNGENIFEKTGGVIPSFKGQLDILDKSELALLFDGNKITYTTIITFLNHILDQSEEILRNDIHGSLKGKLFPIFKRKEILTILQEYGYTYKPNINNCLTQSELKYFLSVKLISLMRSEHKFIQGINLPYLGLVFFGGGIQWLIFIIGNFVIILLMLRMAWFNLQESLIIKGYLDDPSQNLWGYIATSPYQRPYFNILSQKYPNQFLPVLLIERILRTGSNEEDYMKEQVSLMKKEAQDGYYLEHFGWESTTGLGMLGTLWGVVLCFMGASGLINERNPLIQSIEVNNLTGSLSIAFCTTAVGLISSLAISIVHAKSKTKEAKLFDVLINHAVKNLSDQ